MPPRDLRQNVGALAADFRDFIKCMNVSGMLFVLVGGYAVSGCPRQRVADGTLSVACTTLMLPRH